jgi:hypothetical protein
MKRSMTAAIISVTLILLFGASILGFIGSQNATAHNDNNNDGPRNTRRLTDNELEFFKELLEQGHTENLPRFEILKTLLANATTVEINGSIVALVKNELVLNTTTGHETIILPRAWTVDTQVMKRTQLLNSNFSAVGEEVKVMALKLTLFENQNIIINVLYGFEITNAESVTAFALLPFNIETKT